MNMMLNSRPGFRFVTCLFCAGSSSLSVGSGFGVALWEPRHARAGGLDLLCVRKIPLDGVWDISHLHAALLAWPVILSYGS